MRIVHAGLLLILLAVPSWAGGPQFAGHCRPGEVPIKAKRPDGGTRNDCRPDNGCYTAGEEDACPWVRRPQVGCSCIKPG